MAPFASTNINLDPDTFLRHYWASRRGVVRVKALYSQIRPEINDADTAVAFADDLSYCGPLWAAMYDRDSEIWRGYAHGALGALDTLRNLNVEQCRPLLLAGLRYLPESEVEKLLSLVVSWSIRWFVVGGGSAGVTERLYATVAQRISDRKVSKAAEVGTLFSKTVPNDLQFEQAFSVLTVRRGWLARYYLTALERASRGDAEPELVPNQNVDEVNLEHVLPRNPTASDWPVFNAEELQNMRLMLGNQVLLRKSHNQQISNSSFSSKKSTLKESDLVLTREVGEMDEWTPATIRDRQERMAKLAVAVWRKNISSRRL